MRIGLISDTHIPEAVKALPPEVSEAFQGVDLILHAGDIYILSVLDELERVAPILAAKGDDDYGLRDKRIEEIHNLTIEGLTIWLSHTSYTWNIHSAHYPAKKQFEKTPDIIVSGHTHSPIVESHNGTLFINPGSATFPNYQIKLGTVAILTIISGKAEVQIVHLEPSPGASKKLNLL
ncbi:metallophosphoesterase family protein [Chloroflexota bacterium]